MKRLFSVLTAASMLLIADMASATTLGTLAKNAASANTDFRDMFLSFATLAGIFLCMLSLFLFYQESKQPNQGNMKKGVYALVIGIGLLSLEFIAGAGQSQLTGGQADAFNGSVFSSDSINPGASSTPGAGSTSE